MVFALGTVCLLAWLALYWVKRIKVNFPQGIVRIHERVPLEPRKALFVVEVAGAFYLVGAGESGLNLMATLDAAQVSAALAEKKTRVKIAPRSFADLLRKGADHNDVKEKP
jgi:flagellar protein FliO/FliZ